jgi:hypothetical protein
VVSNAPPVLSNVQATPSVTLGDVTTLTGSISDAGGNGYTLVVNWGDGTAAQTFTYDASATSFSQTHKYLVPGTMPVTVTLTDSNGASADAGASVQVHTPPEAAVAFGPKGQVTLVVDQNRMLTEFDASGAHVLGGGVRDASTAFGPAGQILLVTFQDGSLSQFDSAGAHNLGASFSAALGRDYSSGAAGGVYFISNQHDYFFQFGRGSQLISTAPSITRSAPARTRAATT